MHEFNRKIRARAQVTEGEKGRGPSARSPLPRAPHHMEVRRGLRCVTGKNGWLPFKNLKPRAEEFETVFFAKLAFWNAENSLTCMQKTHTFHTLTVRVVAHDEARTRRLRSDDIPWYFTASRTEFHYCCRRSATKKMLRKVIEIRQQKG